MGERHSPSGWKYTNSVSSWAWSGYEGKKAEVEVYACASYIELYLNGKKLKTKSMGKHCVQKFKVPYGRGTLTAIAYNNKKQEIGRSHLQSVNEKTELRIEPENLTIRQGELCYVRLRITDENGTTKVLEKDILQVKVEGGTLMGLGHACPYNNDGYTNDYTSTYWGEALAIVRVGEEGTVKISAKSPKLHGSCQIRVE
jgi:beta-galactosidase